MLSPFERIRTLSRLRSIAMRLPDNSPARKAIEEESDFEQIHRVALSEHAIQAAELDAESEERHAASRWLEHIIAEAASAMHRNTPGWNTHHARRAIRCTVCERTIAHADDAESCGTVYRDASGIYDARCPAHAR